MSEKVSLGPADQGAVAGSADELNALRYPTGPPPKREDASIGTAELQDAIATLAEFPEQLRNAADGLSYAELDTPYRDGGWTVRQVVHHLADSHATALFRFKLALTVDWPTILPYPEDKFAELHDGKAAPVEWSLELVEALHARWVMMLQAMTEESWTRGFVHPERGRMTLKQNLLLYAWHGRHHLAQITHLRARRGW